jgi:ribose-phosphate pyrophosphokinase
VIKIGNNIVNFGHFPDGTTLCKYGTTNNSAYIEWFYESNEEIWNLYALTRHLQEQGMNDIVLFMPYIPNARQDRVKNSDDVFTLKYFSEIINSLNFRGVVTRDAHSNVALALIDRVQDLSVEKYIEKCISTIGLLKEDDVVFYPDEGAMKRYSGRIKFPYAFGVKNRCWETSEILSLDIFGCIPKNPFNVLFVDDIISSGNSLLYSALELKKLGAENIYAYGTHVENFILDGKVVHSGIVNTIYTTNSIFTKEHPIIKVL